MKKKTANAVVKMKNVHRYILGRYSVYYSPAIVLVPHSDWNSIVSGELHPIVRYCLLGGLHGNGLSWLFSVPGRLAASVLPTSSAFRPPLISYRPRNGHSRPLGDGAEMRISGIVNVVKTTILFTVMVFFFAFYRFYYSIDG